MFNLNEDDYIRSVLRRAYIKSFPEFEDLTEEHKEFISLNSNYISNHGLFEKTFDLWKEWKTKVEEHLLQKTTPSVGHNVHILTKRGDVITTPMIVGQLFDTEKIRVCMEASAHVHRIPEDAGAELSTSVSGGYFSGVKEPDTRLVLSEELGSRKFWTWGTSGACAAGGIFFVTKTKIWTLDDSEAIDDFY